jgi:ribosomal protein S12 methylthiotransferase accessory factor
MEMIIRFPGGTRVDAEFGPYTVRTDQPHHAGGEASAPTPFATFLASIGTCAGIYVLGFCRQRGLPTDDLRIVQRMDVDKATGMVANIHLDIHVPAGFPVKYRDALVRSAEQCTVKKHMEAPPRFVVTTVAGVAEAAGGEAAPAASARS